MPIAQKQFLFDPDASAFRIVDVSQRDEVEKGWVWDTSNREAFTRKPVISDSVAERLQTIRYCRAFVSARALTPRPPQVSRRERLHGPFCGRDGWTFSRRDAAWPLVCGAGSSNPPLSRPGSNHHRSGSP